MGVIAKSAVKMRRRTMSIGMPIVVYMSRLVTVMKTRYVVGKYSHQLPGSVSRKSMD
jgi:hypothetical protein